MATHNSDSRERELILQQKFVINHYVRLGKKACDIFNEFSQVYMENALSRAQIYRLVEKAESGESASVRKEGSGRPKSSTDRKNIEKVDEIVRSDRKVTIDAIAEELGLSHGSVHAIVADKLSYKKCLTKWVPKMLSVDQKKNRLEVANEHLTKYAANGWAYMENTITEDESWVYYYDPPSKREAKKWRHSNSPYTQTSLSSRTTTKKLMLVTFFDAKGIICHYFLPRGETMNSATYVNIIKQKLRPAIARKRPELVGPDGEVRWQLHHDNARPHVSLETTAFLTSEGVNVMRHPAYSPDLAPSDFWLYSVLKSDLRGEVFHDDEELKIAVKSALNSIPLERYRKAYENWIVRWQRCVDAGGAYF